MSDQWNEPPASNRATPEQLYGQLPQHIIAEWDGDGWIRLTCTLCPPSVYAAINIKQDGAKAQYDSHIKLRAHPPAPKSEQKVTDTLKDLNDGIPLTSNRTPEEHYHEASIRLGLAERTGASIRERAELDMVPSHTLQTMFARHLDLASAHRLMAETGLAFEKPQPLKQSMGPGEFNVGAPLDVFKELGVSKPTRDRPLVHIVVDECGVDGVYDTESEAIQRRDTLNARSETNDASVVSKYVSTERGLTPVTAQSFVGINGHGLTVVYYAGEYTGDCVCNGFMNSCDDPADIAANWAIHLYEGDPNETHTVKALKCKKRFGDGEYCTRDDGHEGPHFRETSD